MQLVDLSHPITAGMPVYPGDPEVTVEPALSLAEDGAQVSKVTLGTHTGTHLDAPAHVVADGRTVDQLELGLLHGPASVVQTRVMDLQALRGRPLGLEDLAALPERLPAIVCIATGWDQYFHDPGPGRPPLPESRCRPHALGERRPCTRRGHTQSRCDRSGHHGPPGP